MSEQIIIRLDPGLKAEASRLAKAEGKNLSAVVRDLLARYIQERDMSAYVNSLLDNMGETMAQNGFGPGDIGQAIRDYRASTK